MISVVYQMKGFFSSASAIMSSHLVTQPLTKMLCTIQQGHEKATLQWLLRT